MWTIDLLLGGMGLIHCIMISVRRLPSQFDDVLGCLPEKVLKVLL